MSTNRDVEEARNRMEQARKNMNKSIAAKIKNSDPKAAALAAWPIFGGTSPGATTTNPPASTETSPAATTSGSSTPPGGSVVAPDPLETLRKDPNALTQLLSQVQTLNTQVQALTTENTAFKDAKTAEERSKLAKEQQLQQDLENERLKTEKAVNLLHQKVLENALATHKDFQWHDAASVLAKVDQNAVKVTIDIEKGIAQIEGMEAEIKRIARENAWMLSKGPAEPGTPAANSANPAAPIAGRPTGSPPVPANNDAAKAAKRTGLLAKYPVIRH